MNITVDRSVIEQALEALEEVIEWYGSRDNSQVLMAPNIQNPEIKQAMEIAPALRTALERPERKPLTQDLQAPLTLNGVALYPRQQPLSDEEKLRLCKQFPDHLTFKAIEAVEAAHGIKGDA